MSRRGQDHASAPCPQMKTCFIHPWDWSYSVFPHASVLVVAMRNSASPRWWVGKKYTWIFFIFFKKKNELNFCIFFLSVENTERKEKENNTPFSPFNFYMIMINWNIFYTFVLYFYELQINVSKGIVLPHGMKWNIQLVLFYFA